MASKPRPPRALIVLFALAVLFETWIWNGMMAVMRRLAALVPWAGFKQAFVRLVDWLPVWATLLIFGVPFVLNELGGLGCVLLAATGHVVLGAVGYVLLKVVGLGLVAAIFDLSRHRLLTMPWFAYLYDKLLVFHAYAHDLVAPYRDAALAHIRPMRIRLRAYFARRLVGVRGRAPKARGGRSAGVASDL